MDTERPVLFLSFYVSEIVGSRANAEELSVGVKQIQQLLSLRTQLVESSLPGLEGQKESVILFVVIAAH